MSSDSSESCRSKPNSMYRIYNKESSIAMGQLMLDTKYDKLPFEYNECSKLFPSTPTYSDSSIKICDSDFGDVGPSNKRFLVIIIASIAYFLQVFSQSIWGAIYEPALIAFPNWTCRSLKQLPIWASLMTVILVFPACSAINKFGLKVSLFAACCMLTVGTAARCSTSIYSSTACLHWSAAFLSMGGVFMTPLMVTISAQWFPKNERNMATGFGSAVGILGSAATYLIGPKLVYAESGGLLDPYEMRVQIMSMLYTCFGLNVFVTLMVFIFFPHHTLPVSHSSKRSIASHQSAEIISSFMVLVKDSNFWCLVLAFTLSNTMSSPWSALLPSTFSKLHVPSELSAKCSLFVVIHCFALSMTLSVFADRAPGYNKNLALYSRFVSLVFIFWLMLMINFHVTLTTTTLVYAVLIAFPYCWCNQSLLYEMGIEMKSELPESFVTGYMTLLNNLFVDFVYLILYFFPRFDEYWLLVGVFVFSILSIIFLMRTDVCRTLPL